LILAEVTVAAIARADDRYLVVEEFAHGRRVINQPAGHVEAGETIIDAVIRETREETAWGFVPAGLVGVYYWPHEDGRTTLRFAFCGEPSDHAVGQPLDDGIIAAHWLTRAELGARDDLRSPLVMHALEDFTQHEPLPLERVRHIHGR